MFTFSNTLLILSATFAALVAGLFYGWSVSVILGLKRLADKEYVSFMQATNRAIINPFFFITFIGTVFLLPLVTYLQYENEARFWYLLAATLSYLIGVFGVTMFGNVPLNNELESFDMKSADENEISTQRKNYEGRWAMLNHIRALFSTITIMLIIVACMS